MISVVIPLFNKAPYVDICIKSVLHSAEYIDVGFEIIVIDDCSSDNSVNVVEDFFPSVRLIRLPRNSGPSVARNLGVRIASFDMVYFLDADDFVSPHFFSKLVDTIVKFPDRKVFTFGIRSVSKEQNISLWDKSNNIAESCDKFEYHRGLCSGKLVFSASSTCLHKSVFESVGYFNESSRYSEDAEFWARVSEYYDVVFDKSWLVAYRSVPDSLSQKTFSNLTSKPILISRLYEQACNYNNCYIVKAAFSVMFFKYLILASVGLSKTGKQLIFSFDYFKKCTLYYKFLSIIVMLTPSCVMRIFFRAYIYYKNLRLR
ncbi:MAG: glycosyltransferase family 2 protein [Shewanella sp.]